MKKILITSGIIVAILAGVLLLSQSKVASALESYFGTTVLNNATATTTMSYMSPGAATTTFAFDTYNADQVDVWIQMKASSTASTLNFKWEGSNNGVDWFGENRETVTTNILIAHSSTTPVHTYTPGQAGVATTSIMVQAPNFSSFKKRIVFSVPAGSANLAIYAEANIKRNAQ